jgi:hypothetical protein
MYPPITQPADFMDGFKAQEAIYSWMSLTILLFLKISSKI